MKIRQAFVGNDFFEKPFLNKFGLVSYNNPNKPAIFFGLYPLRPRHISLLGKHKGLAVIIWAGSDILTLLKKPIYIKYIKYFNKSNVKHIAISKYIEKDLQKLKLQYIKLPITPFTYEDYKTEPCGTDVYVYSYSPHNKPKKVSDFYHYTDILSIKSQFPELKFHICNPAIMNRKEVKEIYKKCFVGIRMVNHDGLSNTIIELGLMGRRVISNSNITNCLQYNSVKDIINHINTEKNRIGNTYTNISEEIKKYLTIPLNWLYTDFYE